MARKSGIVLISSLKDILYIVRISFLGVIAHKFLKDVLSAHQFLIEGAKCSQVH